MECWTYERKMIGRVLHTIASLRTDPFDRKSYSFHGRYTTGDNRLGTELVPTVRRMTEEEEERRGGKEGGRPNDEIGATVGHTVCSG